jgi:hypothetical protein
LRRAAVALWLALGACVSNPYHSCPGPCGSGQSCDTAVGQCHEDPCEGRCARGERCEAGPPAQCIIVPLSELEVTRPDTSSPAGMLH